METIEEMLWELHLRGCEPGNIESNEVCKKYKEKLLKKINKQNGGQ